MTIIVLDQFTGPTPYALDRYKPTWEEFMAAVDAGKYGCPTITDESHKMWRGTTAYVERDGRVAVWKACWDSSG